jgi:twitching motility protein PilT
MASSDDALVSRIALHYKLVTQEQLDAALKLGAQKPGERPLAELLVEMKVLSSEQLNWLNQAQQQFLEKQRAGARPSAPAAAPSPAARPSAPAPAGAPAPAARPSAPAPAAAIRGGTVTLRDVLSRAVAAKASDVHIHAGSPIQMRVGGVLRELNTGVLTSGDVEMLLRQGLTQDEQKVLDERLDYDAALVVPQVGRFRASFYKQQRGFDGVFRPIPENAPSLSELGLPEKFSELAQFHQGLILFTGPAGSGKSSTLAAVVNMINESREDHIITVEDPIEYVFTKKKCVVNQRQVGKHTQSFANALRAALREDPDIIVIGELRDLETIQLAITAAETGHLVLGTLHTNNAIRTINRVLDVFPPKQQSQIRAMVSESLRAIVSQRLLPSADGKSRVPALEVLKVKPSVSNLIREEKTFQIRSVMQTGRNDGMILLDDSIAEMVKLGQVTKEVARRFAEDPKRFV